MQAVAATASAKCEDEFEDDNEVEAEIYEEGLLLQGGSKWSDLDGSDLDPDGKESTDEECRYGTY